MDFRQFFRPMPLSSLFDLFFDTIPTTEVVRSFEERSAFQQKLLTEEHFYTLAPKFAVVVGGAVVFHFLRLFFQQVICRPIFVSMNIVREDTMKRILESAYYAVYYTFASCLGLYVYLSEPWNVFPTTNIWVGWPLQPFPPAFEFYYLMALAFYSHALFSLLFVDTKRKDFMEYLLHHVICIYLIVNSYYVCIHRYGLIILMLHDLGDMVLYNTKVFKYLNYETCTNIGFGLFALSFFFTRIVFLPLAVIPSGYWESADIDLPIPGWLVMNISLMGLQVLHCVWFTFLVQAIVKVAKGGSPDDVRSDDEGEAVEEEKGAAKDKSMRRRKTPKA